MTTHFSRLLAATALVLSAATGAFSASSAFAATNWTDISSRLGFNRYHMLQHVAYASPYWYYTDGRDVRYGGKVARTDGVWTKDLTAEVRASGMDRVDDVIGYADGSVVFLKQTQGKVVMARLRQPEPNIKYVDYTSRFKNIPYADVLAMHAPSIQVGNPTLLNSGINWSKSTVVHNGAAWYILEDHKTLYRYDGATVSKLGRLNGYFTGFASDGKGRLVFVGANATTAASQPSYPLMAKLMVANDTQYIKPTNVVTQPTTPAPTPTTSPIATTFWTWTAPTIDSIARNGWTTYHVGAWNGDGLKSIEIFANGVSKKICTDSTTTQNCAIDVYGADYPTANTIELKGLVMNVRGEVVSTTPTTLQITQSTSYPTNGTIAPEVEARGDLNPAVTTLTNLESTTFQAQGRAAYGLARLEIWANQNIIRTCVYPNVPDFQGCDTTINGKDFPAGSHLDLVAHAIDMRGHDAWSGIKPVDVKSSSTPANTNLYTWTWSTPETSVLASTGTPVTYSIGASDPDMVKRIEIYVNDTFKAACDFPQSYGNRTCQTILNSADYANGSQVLVKSQILDFYGNGGWSDVKSYTVNR